MDANEGVRRRLPSWMLGDQAGSKSIASNVNDGDDVKECNENEEKDGKRSRKAKPKVQKEGNETGKASMKKASSTVLAKRQTRKRGKREVTPDEDDDDEISLDDEFYEEAPRKKRKSKKEDKTCLDDEFYEEAPRKKRKSRKEDKTCLEIETDMDVEHGLEDGETEDLTVEDLVSIAKEYVEEDNKAQRDIAGNQSREKVIGSFENLGTSSYSVAENSTSDTGLKPDVSSSMSMLDLMLGPLYTKAKEQEKEKQLNLEIESFKYKEIKQPSAVDVVQEPVAVPKKKKSSLKDMVAMYLN